MFFAAQSFALHTKLGNPTVVIVVDRIDLDTQITATFNASDVPNMVGVETRNELEDLFPRMCVRCSSLQSISSGKLVEN